MTNSTSGSEPLVSVCIPTYNRADKLLRAIDAVLSCSYTNLEIIISDNASGDDTRRVCMMLTNADTRVKYFRHIENQGPTKNFEFAKSQATGKYFLWLSDDDYHGPDYIRTCVNELEHDPSLVLVAGLGAYHRGDGIITHYENLIQPSSDVPLLRVLKYLWYVGESSIYYGVCRRDQAQQCRQPNCLAGDWAWVAEVLLRGKARVMPMTYIYREFGESLSSSYKLNVSTLGVPKWHADFPWLAMSINIAGHLALKSHEYKDKTIFKQFLIYMLIFATVLLKRLDQQIYLFGSKVPFAKRIYRRLVKKQIVA